MTAPGALAGMIGGTALEYAGLRGGHASSDELGRMIAGGVNTASGIYQQGPIDYASMKLDEQVRGIQDAGERGDFIEQGQRFTDTTTVLATTVAGAAAAARTLASSSTKIITASDSGMEIRFMGADSDFGPLNQPPKLQGPVQALDVGTYAELNKRAVRGDRLTPDHQPSFASVLLDEQTRLGRRLTEAEKKALYNCSTCVTIPENAHMQNSRTSGGRNSSTRIASDAQNQPSAASADSEELRAALIASGLSEHAIDAAFNLRDRLNVTRERYRYKPGG